MCKLASVLIEDCQECPLSTECTELVQSSKNKEIDKSIEQTQIISEFADMLIKDFVQSADNQEYQSTANILRNVCPAKVRKIQKRLYKIIKEEQEEIK